LIREGETLGAQRVNQQLQKEQFPFQVGEWLIRGEDEGFISGCVTPNYREAARLTGYSRQTLYKFAYVARHVPVCIRMQKLPWAIHQAVAPLGERCGQHVQKEFLQHADTAHLSVAKFRAFVNEKLAEQVELGVLKKQGVPVDPASNPNLRADQRAARFMIACWDLLPANYRKLVESPMTSTVRAKLAEELEHTAARLLACANEVRKWGELPLEDQWTQGTYKFENDQRAKAAKDRAKAANPSK